MSLYNCLTFSFARNGGKNFFLNSRNFLKPADGNSNFNAALEESLLELERLGTSHVVRSGQIRAISSLASGQDLLAVLKRGR